MGDTFVFCAARGCIFDHEVAPRAIHLHRQLLISLTRECEIFQIGPLLTYNTADLNISIERLYFEYSYCVCKIVVSKLLYSLKTMIMYLQYLPRSLSRSILDVRNIIQTFPVRSHFAHFLKTEFYSFQVSSKDCGLATFFSRS